MRCGCRICGAFMIQTESGRMGCVCPECGEHCGDCLGTDTVVSRNHLAALAEDPRFAPETLEALFRESGEEGSSDFDGNSPAFRTGNSGSPFGGPGNTEE